MGSDGWLAPARRTGFPLYLFSTSSIVGSHLDDPPLTALPAETVYLSSTSIFSPASSSPASIRRFPLARAHGDCIRTCPVGARDPGRPTLISTLSSRIRSVRTARHGFCDILNISALILSRHLGWKQGWMDQMHDIEARCRFTVDATAGHTGNLPVSFFLGSGFIQPQSFFPLACTIPPPPLFTICVDFLRAGRAAGRGCRAMRRSTEKGEARPWRTGIWVYWCFNGQSSDEKMDPQLTGGSFERDALGEKGQEIGKGGARGGQFSAAQPAGSSFGHFPFSGFSFFDPVYCTAQHCTPALHSDSQHRDYVCHGRD